MFPEPPGPTSEPSFATGMAEGSVWSCLTTQPRREHIAAAGLRKRMKEAEVFCPRLSFVKKTRRGKVRFVEALFPGYLFVSSPLENTRRLMESVPGVRGVVRLGGSCVTVPPKVIEELQARFPEGLLYEPDPELCPGTEVAILEGPFSSLHGVVSSRIPGTRRIAVLLDMLGRELSIQLPEEALLPASYKPRGAIRPKPAP